MINILTVGAILVTQTGNLNQETKILDNTSHKHSSVEDNQLSSSNLFSDKDTIALTELDDSINVVQHFDNAIDAASELAKLRNELEENAEIQKIIQQKIDSLNQDLDKNEEVITNILDKTKNLHDEIYNTDAALNELDLTLKIKTYSSLKSAHKELSEYLMSMKINDENIKFEWTYDHLEQYSKTDETLDKEYNFTSDLKRDYKNASKFLKQQIAKYEGFKLLEKQNLDKWNETSTGFAKIKTINENANAEIVELKAQIELLNQYYVAESQLQKKIDALTQK